MSMLRGGRRVVPASWLYAFMAVTAAFVGSCTSTRQSRPQPVMTDVTQTQLDGPVARTDRFLFYSRFDFNLHDRLLRWAVENDRAGADCIGALGDPERQNWDRAVDAFRALGAGGMERTALRLRYERLKPGDASFNESLGAVPGWYRPALANAASAYRRCWWPEDDRRNRAWIHALVPRLLRAEGIMARRIAAAHGVDFQAEPIPVDVVPKVNFGGGNTVVHPHHILISSMQPGYDGFGGVELIFHEASHTIVNPRSDGSIAALRGAAQQQRVQLPRDLWHAVLFFTAGHAARATIREAWGEPYEPYMYTQGLFTRAWPRWRGPLEQWWKPYLDGLLTLDEASARLVAATAEGPR